MNDILNNLSPEILSKFEAVEFEGLIKLELQDETKLSCYMELNGKIEIKETIASGTHPDMIIRGSSADLEALLTGKMSFADGFVSERISFVGDLAKITGFKSAVQKQFS